MPRKPKVPSSVVVAQVNDSAGPPVPIQDGETESQMMVGLDHAPDVSEEEDGEFAEDISEEEDGEFAEDVSEEGEEEDGEFAAAVSNDDEDGAEMDVTEHQLSDVMDVHQLEESIHMQSQLRNAEEEIEAGAAPMDASMAEPPADKEGSSEAGDEMEGSQSEVEASVGDLDRDEQDLPAWYRIFDLNVVETPEGCEMPHISGDSPANRVCDSVPDLAAQMNQQTKYASSEIQGQDEHAGANHSLEYGHDLSKYDLNNVADEHAQDDTSNTQGQDEDSGDNQLLEDEHDLSKCDLNHEADADAQDNYLLSNEEIRLNHGMSENGADSCCLSNEQMLLKKNADEQDHDDHQLENEQMLFRSGNI
ncbi:hypothetical protein PR202_ga18482 [Eleusine coracana subsp. coracana]|uniref:Uncharacterized protein n=1 Tax=Eleusine coracana subsp. coracana TaxID=191504 RepID=A0AAV5CT27_ELECO|nr:hypothetical protein PR202_ga18482 [Eleusine coracana subsp. coracana]